MTPSVVAADARRSPRRASPGSRTARHPRGGRRPSPAWPAAMTRTPDHIGSMTGSAMSLAERSPNAWGRRSTGRARGGRRSSVGHRSGPWRRVSSPRGRRRPADWSRDDRRRPARGLAGLTPSGRAIVPAAWSLYDFANTIFSFAVVSGAIGLYLNDQFGERDGGRLSGRRGRGQRRAQRASCRRSSAPSRTAAAGACRSCCSSRPCASARRFFIGRCHAAARGWSCSSSPTSPTRRPSSTTTRRSRPCPTRRRAAGCRGSGPRSAIAGRSSSGC